jgi:hypothetical protein
MTSSTHKLINTLYLFFHMLSFLCSVATKAASSASFEAHQRYSHPIMKTSQSNYLPKKPLQLQISFTSIYILLHHFSIIGFIIFIIYLLEYYPPFSNGQRFKFDSDLFVFLILIVSLLGIFSVARNTNPGDYAGQRQVQNKENNEQHLQNSNSSTSSSSSSSSGDSVSTFSTKPYDTTMNNQEDDDKYNSANGSSTSISTPKRRVIHSSDSINSDDLLSSLEKKDASINIAKENNNRNVKSTSYQITSNNSDLPDPTSSSPTTNADKILDEILLNEDNTKSNSVVQSNSNALAETPVLSSNLDVDVLNIHQSLELKGFMTICFLMYQFTNAHSYESESSEIMGNGEGGDGGTDTGGVNFYYNASRIYVTAFLFLTGYGHTMFFYREKDYSMNRLIEVLFRMNFSGMFLCLALGKPYIFYKACWLHSYFFLFIYFTMKWKKVMNYTKYGLRLKMAFFAIVIFLLWDCDYSLWSIHVPLFGTSKQSVDGAPYGQLWEFYFQGHLHHWASFIGMLFAVNHPVTSLLLRKLEAFGQPIEILFKAISGILLMTTTIVWALGPFDSSKFLYNATNPYFGTLPVLCYIFFRNITPTLREHHVQVFKAVGIYSLEIYLLHHHLFIAEDGMAKKILLPGYPICNLLCTIWLMIVLAKALKKSTYVVTIMLTSQKGEKMKSGRNVTTIMGTLIILHSISIILQFLEMNSPETIATITIICGILLYQTVMDLTWKETHFTRLPLHDTASINTMHTSNPISPVSKTSPPIIGTLTILLICLIWQIASLKGNPTSKLLHPVCRNTANEGKWVSINSCSEFQQGRNARDFHSRSSNTKCFDNYQWGWSNNEMSSECKFHFLEPLEAQQKLHGKTLIFIGDTMTRNLFFAACRVLGDTAADTNDESLPVHSEITKKFGSITMSFKWAPLATDIVGNLNAYKTSAHLIVAGSGAWDKLHLWATDEDQKSHIISLKRLARELQSLKENSIPTIWFTPTTINTRALSNEERRTQMSETSVQEMRDLYAENGVDAAAGFVLQGHTFTETQAHQSHDGVHYPPHIYNVGAQIMMNSLDWLLPNIQLPTKYVDASFTPKTGSMANRSLGLMVLGLILIGLLFFDGFFGLFYIASIFIQPRKTPNRVGLSDKSRENQARHSFTPSSIYAEVNLFMQKKSKASQKNNQEHERSNGISKTRVTIPSRRSLGNLATISEDSNSNIS